MLKRNITKLLICGGGFKMFYLVGAIKYLIEINVLQNIKEYIGVSAGSILAFLFLIGYTTNDLNNFFLEFNFEKLIAPNLDTFFDTKGLDNGDNKKIALEQFMKKKGIKPDITFLELYQLTNKKLSVIVSNMSKNQIEIINHETYPDMLITKGLIMTSALPILFEPVIYNNDHFVDGGVFDNYPIDLFDNDEILGINMTVDVSDLNFNTEFFNYIIKLLMLSWHYKDNIKSKTYISKTIEIITNNTQELIDPNVLLEERINRIKKGYDSALYHFKTYEFKEEKEDEENDEEKNEEDEEDEEDKEDEENEENEEDEEEEENINKLENNTKVSQEDINYII
jgi:predicted acylesterase/phospholipase RssA